MVMETKEFNQLLAKYQQKTFRTRADLQVKSIEDAVNFVNDRGYIHFWSIKGWRFPSLWAAVAGDRPVPNNHDDPGHITWGWKDEMLGKKRWYYGRHIGKKNCFISIESLPYFYALSPNYGEYEEDYLIQYQQGMLTAEAKAVYEAILFEGPLDTLSLRKQARLSSSESSSRFQRALDLLQFEFKIMPVGISRAGAWRYAFIYDIVPRHFSFLEDRTRVIGERKAQLHLLRRYLISVGMVDYKQIKRIFHWEEKAINQMVDKIHLDQQLKLIKIQVGDESFVVLQDVLNG
jgi:hypothetical protein